MENYSREYLKRKVQVIPARTTVFKQIFFKILHWYQDMTMHFRPSVGFACKRVDPILLTEVKSSLTFLVKSLKRKHGLENI